MSSMSLRILLPALVAITPINLLAQDLMAAQPRASIQSVNDSALSVAISEWNALRQSDGLPFSFYARFLIAHPGWPMEANLRKSAERALRTDAEDPQLVVAYFGRYAPTTASTMLRHAEALDAIGRRDEARGTARRAWTMGALNLGDDQRLTMRWPGLLTSADHDARMERLLANRTTASAAQLLALTSPARQPVFAARIAMQARNADAATQLSYVAGRASGDPGFLADRATWLRTTGQEYAAQALLAAPRRLNAPPLDAERWFELLLGTARNAAAQGQTTTAYDIARQVDDAYAPGTSVRDRPIGERDDYTSLTWLAGTTALNRLNRPVDAIRMFDLYARAAKSPQTQSKGLYWAGRAAQAAGRASDATRYFESAAGFYDQFYGQLATERLGRVPAIPAPTSRLEISRNERDAFLGQEIVRAAQILGQRGDWATQTQFVRQIAQAASSETDHVLALELSQRLVRPDLAVMVGRSAGINDHRDTVRAGFPLVPVPDEARSNSTMVHAISRQESQFDRAAVSHAGARGMMQLMPGTAREQAGKMGLNYDLGGLTTNTQYNIRLGNDYFQRMMSYFGGSYPLAVAAYNAGPGNVNKWLRANGDPRSGVDILTWIEAIPLTETRGYVQRVLENAVVYDLVDPARARIRSNTPLSAYLGKRSPG